MRQFLKKIPGLPVAVQAGRSLRRKAYLLSLGYLFRLLRRKRDIRIIAFDALPEEYALALHPEESYLVCTADKMISARLYARGHFDLQKLVRAVDLIRDHAGSTQGSVLIDAGANLGSICIPAVRRGMVARAIAFELDPGNTRLLRINALLNEVEDRIDIRNNAVGAAPGEVTVQHSDTNFGDHRVGTPASGEGVSVPMVALDSIAGDLDLSQCLLWMDVQGYEAFALQGAQKFMAAGVPLIAEFSRKEFDSTGSFDLFVSLVTSAGYSVFFDLNEAAPKATPLDRAALETLSDRLTEQGTFTDLLFLPVSTASS